MASLDSATFYMSWSHVWQMWCPTWMILIPYLVQAIIRGPLGQVPGVPSRKLWLCKRAHRGIWMGDTSAVIPLRQLKVVRWGMGYISKRHGIIWRGTILGFVWVAKCNFTKWPWPNEMKILLWMICHFKVDNEMYAIMGGKTWPNLLILPANSILIWFVFHLPILIYIKYGRSQVRFSELHKSRLG